MILISTVAQVLLGGEHSFSIMGEAAQVCYSYDLLGRLIRVADARGDTAHYDYDAAGKVVAIRRDSLVGPVAIATVAPPSAPPGALFEISGIGFSTVISESQ